MFATWKRYRDQSRRREASLAAEMGSCAGACFAQTTRDRARTQVTLVTGSLL